MRRRHQRTAVHGVAQHQVRAATPPAYGCARRCPAPGACGDATSVRLCTALPSTKCMRRRHQRTAVHGVAQHQVRAATPPTYGCARRCPAPGACGDATSVRLCTALPSTRCMRRRHQRTALHGVAQHQVHAATPPAYGCARRCPAPGACGDATSVRLCTALPSTRCVRRRHQRTAVHGVAQHQVHAATPPAYGFARRCPAPGACGDATSVRLCTALPSTRCVRRRHQRTAVHGVAQHQVHAATPPAYGFARRCPAPGACGDATSVRLCTALPSTRCVRRRHQRTAVHGVAQHQVHAATPPAYGFARRCPAPGACGDATSVRLCTALPSTRCVRRRHQRTAVHGVAQHQVHAATPPAYGFARRCPAPGACGDATSVRLCTALPSTRCVRRRHQRTAVHGVAQHQVHAATPPAYGFARRCPAPSACGDATSVRLCTALPSTRCVRRRHQRTAVHGVAQHQVHAATPPAYGFARRCPAPSACGDATSVRLCTALPSTRCVRRRHQRTAVHGVAQHQVHAATPPAYGFARRCPAPGACGDATSVRLCTALPSTRCVRRRHQRTAVHGVAQHQVHAATPPAYGFARRCPAPGACGDATSVRLCTALPSTRCVRRRHQRTAVHGVAQHQVHAATPPAYGFARRCPAPSACGDATSVRLCTALPSTRCVRRRHQRTAVHGVAQHQVHAATPPAYGFARRCPAPSACGDATSVRLCTALPSTRCVRRRHQRTAVHGVAQHQVHAATPPAYGFARRCPAPSACGDATSVRLCTALPSTRCVRRRHQRTAVHGVAQHQVHAATPPAYGFARRCPAPSACGDATSVRLCTALPSTRCVRRRHQRTAVHGVAQHQVHAATPPAYGFARRCPAPGACGDATSVRLCTALPSTRCVRRRHQRTAVHGVAQHQVHAATPPAYGFARRCPAPSACGDATSVRLCTALPSTRCVRRRHQRTAVHGVAQHQVHAATPPAYGFARRCPAPSACGDATSVRLCTALPSTRCVRRRHQRTAVHGVAQHQVHAATPPAYGFARRCPAPSACGDATSVRLCTALPSTRCVRRRHQRTAVHGVAQHQVHAATPPAYGFARRCPAPSACGDATSVRLCTALPSTRCVRRRHQRTAVHGVAQHQVHAATPPAYGFARRCPAPSACGDATSVRLCTALPSTRCVRRRHQRTAVHGVAQHQVHAATPPAYGFARRCPAPSACGDATSVRLCTALPSTRCVRRRHQRTAVHGVAQHQVHAATPPAYGFARRCPAPSACGDATSVRLCTALPSTRCVRRRHQRTAVHGVAQHQVHAATPPAYGFARRCPAPSACGDATSVRLCTALPSTRCVRRRHQRTAVHGVAQHQVHAATPPAYGFARRCPAPSACGDATSVRLCTALPSTRCVRRRHQRTAVHGVAQHQVHAATPPAYGFARRCPAPSACGDATSVRLCTALPSTRCVRRRHQRTAVHGVAQHQVHAATPPAYGFARRCPAPSACGDATSVRLCTALPSTRCVRRRHQRTAVHGVAQHQVRAATPPAYGCARRCPAPGACGDATSVRLCTALPSTKCMRRRHQRTAVHGVAQHQVRAATPPAYGCARRCPAPGACGDATSVRLCTALPSTKCMRRRHQRTAVHGVAQHQVRAATPPAYGCARRCPAPGACGDATSVRLCTALPSTKCMRRRHQRTAVHGVAQHQVRAATPPTYGCARRCPAPSACGDATSVR